MAALDDTTAGFRVFRGESTEMDVASVVPDGHRTVTVNHSEN